MSFLKKVIIAISIITISAIALLICAEIFIGILRGIKHRIHKEEKIEQSIAKYNALDLEYAPWVQFKQADLNDGYFNVTGFLRKSKPETNGNVKVNENDIYDIYFFGGSTMQGVNVSDDGTIPSQFAAILRSENKKLKVRVWNYGQPYYYSTQELFLLFNMIVEGRHPKAVVFLDGLNEIMQPESSYYRYPFFTPALKEIFLKQMQRGKSVKDRDIRYISYRMPPGVSESDLADKIVKNYLDSIKTTQILCKAFNIKCYFFWQPVSYYNYDRSNDAICDKRSFSLFARIYPIIKNEAIHTPGLYYLGDLLSEYKGSPFVDKLHYSSSFNKLIAKELLQTIPLPDDSDQ